MKIEEKNECLDLLGKNIKKIRVLRGLTQEELADKLNKSTNFISLIERGASGISISTIVDICNALNISPNLIFSGLICSVTEQTPSSDIDEAMKLFNDKDKKIVLDLINYIKDNKY